VLKHRTKLIRLAIVAACLGGLIWTVSSLGPRQLLGVALRADPLWLALSLIPLGGRFVIWGYKWTRMLARREAVPFGLALRILAAGSFVNLTTPTAKLAGGVVRGLLLHRRRGWGLAACYGWSMADQITNVLGHLMLYVVLAAGVALVLPGEWQLAFAFSSLAMLLALTAMTALRGWGWRQVERPAMGARLAALLPARFRKEDSGSSTAEVVRQVLDPLLREGGGPATFVGDVALAAVAFGSLCVANAMVLRALDVEASLLLVSTVIVLGYFAGVVVGAWGGVGVTEVAITALYVHFGIPADEAAAAALLHRAMYYALILGGGGLALLYESRRQPAE